MTVSLPSYYRATAVPEALRGRQCQLCRTPIDEVYDFCFPPPRMRTRHDRLTFPHHSRYF